MQSDGLLENLTSFLHFVVIAGLCLLQQTRGHHFQGVFLLIISLSPRFTGQFSCNKHGILGHPSQLTVGSLRFDDGNVNDNVNDNATNQWFHWLNEEKWSCCTCGTRFGAMFWRSLPSDDGKFWYLRFWRQRELTAVNLSFFAFTWKPFVPSKRKCTPPILYDVINVE